MRRGIAACLAGDGFVIRGESGALSPEPVVDDIDVLIFDAAPGALRRAVRLVADRPVKLIALLRSPDEPTVVEVVEAGVASVLIQSELTPAVLVASVRAVVAGTATLPQDLLPRLLVHATRVGLAGPGALTSREREVLRLLADGMDTREIATGLSYSERTVKGVVHDVLMKLNCRTRAHAVAQATRSGVI